jgi:hypothetical protein
VVNDGLVREELGTVLNNLIDSFCKFKGKYSIIENNYLYMPIYCNPRFGYGRGLIHKLDEHFFEINGDMVKRNLVIGITWNSLSSNGRLLSRIEIQARHGIFSQRKSSNYLKQHLGYVSASRESRVEYLFSPTAQNTNSREINRWQT